VCIESEFIRLSSSANADEGARLVTAGGIRLPLERTSLSCEAGGGLARSVLRQTFRNASADTLEVIYLVPLPADGALSGYSFTLAGVTTRGRVEARELARERYDQALLDGRSAALLEQERTNLFRQYIGNLPPGARVELELHVDHPLSWLGNGWELRFPTVVAPRYHAGDERSPRVPITLAHDEGVVIGGRHDVALTIADALTLSPHSPSHSLTLTEGDTTRVAIIDAQLDRDVVVRWGVALPRVGARLETARAASGHARSAHQLGLLTLVPPRANPRSLPRDLIVLLDTSGSMAGEPLAQAVRVVGLLLESLGDADRFELVEFGSRANRWRTAAVCATSESKLQARTWLASLRGSGGTDMKPGIDAALTTLRPGALRQVLLVSDGLISFEQEILQQLRERLPTGCRFHCLGVGHGINSALLHPAARAGRGSCVIVTPSEDVEPACARLLAATAAPLVVELRVSGSALVCAARHPHDLLAGAPVLLPLALRAEGGHLEIRGETPDGPFAAGLEVAEREAGTGSQRVLSLYGRSEVEDLELARAAGATPTDTADRNLCALGTDFQIATRLTSWLAVSEQVNVDPTHCYKRVEQPHGLAAGMWAEGSRLRAEEESIFGALQVRAGLKSSSRSCRGGEPSGARSPAPAEALPSAATRPSLRQAFPGFFNCAREVVVPGLIQRNDAEGLTVSFHLPTDAYWTWPQTVLLELADGGGLALHAPTQHRTSGGPGGAGVRVRVSCPLTTALGARPVAMRIVNGGSLWVVELEARSASAPNVGIPRGMLIVVMGVTGAGKSLLGKKLAMRLGLPFFDADDFHPPSNKLKMAANQPLADADRAPWLERLAVEVERWEASGGAVLACSALKRSYRAQLLARVSHVHTVLLDVERPELVRRLEARRGQHEFIAAFDRILDEQLQDLEPPDDAIVLPGTISPDEGVERVARLLLGSAK
jgi:Ca-activated chloride channel family protein